MSSAASEPISSAEMAASLQRVINIAFTVDIADAPAGAVFELTAPATGQRFQVTVAEVPGWSDLAERGLSALTRQDDGS